MPRNRRSTPERRAERLYSWLVRFYPRAHRQAFGEQMQQAFRDHYHDAVEGGTENEAEFWLGVISDESKSLLREHSAALIERIERARSTMSTLSAKKLLLSFWVPVVLIAVVLFIMVIVGLLHTSGFDSNGAGFLLMLLLVYAVLLYLIARFLGGLTQRQRSGSWQRLALMLGVIFGLCMVAISLLYRNHFSVYNFLINNVQARFIPLPFYNGNDYSEDVWALSPLLMIGVIGVLAGYGTRKLRTGMAAGLLASVIALFMNSMSLVPGIISALNSQGPRPDIQGIIWDWIQFSLHRFPAFGQGFGLLIAPQYPNDVPSFAFTLIGEVLTTILVIVIAVFIGTLLGVYATRRTNDIQQQQNAAAMPLVRVQRRGRSILFTVTLLAFCLFTWASYQLLQATFALHEPSLGVSFLLGAVASSYATPGFISWLSIFLFMLAAIALTVRRPPAQQPATEAQALA